MPTWLKVTLSIIGILCLCDMKIKLTDTTIFDVASLVFVLAAILGVIFLPWVIK